MLYYEVYEQLPPKAIPGTLHTVVLESRKAVTVPDFAANLQPISRGEAETAEQAWERAKKLSRHPVLKFPEVRYRQPKEE